jgi:hypothetical protein
MPGLVVLTIRNAREVGFSILGIAMAHQEGLKQRFGNWE